MDRRSFLKRLGASALAVVAAPLYIPSDRLDFGVPTGRLIAPGPPKIVLPSEDWGDPNPTKVLRSYSLLADGTPVASRAVEIDGQRLVMVQVGRFAGHAVIRLQQSDDNEHWHDVAGEEHLVPDGLFSSATMSASVTGRYLRTVVDANMPNSMPRASGRIVELLR